MINYIEKGIGLHDYIASLGLPALEFRDGEWWHPNPEQVQPIIDGYSIESVRVTKCAQVSSIAKAIRDKAISSVSPGEMASWPLKVSEARIYAETGDSTKCPMLFAEATARNITLAELVGKVGSNTAFFATLEAQIAGNDGRHRDAINKLTDFDSLVNYDINDGWPGM